MDNRLSWEGAVRWLLDQPAQQELVQAAYFDLPTSGAARRYHESEEFSALRTYLDRPGRAIDLGAGNGILSYALAADGWQVTAVEPDPSDMVGAGAIRSLARDTGTPIEVVEAFGEAIPLEAAGYDLVIARQVLHHAHDLSQFCREMARLARPGGQVITLRDHVISGPEQLQPFLDSHPLHHLYGGEHAYTIDAYRNALSAAGLTIEITLRSFDSVINYAPVTAHDIREAASEFGPALLKPITARVAAITPLPILCAAATAVDRRPGRLVSFVARKAHGA